MSNLKTLLEIFLNEPDNAEIKASNEPWRTVHYYKYGAIWSWQELNGPVWQVKRKPREFEIHFRADGSYFLVGELRNEINKIKVVEVLDE